MVVLQHGDELGSSESEDYALFRRLLQRCDLWLEVTNLSSQTHGEVRLSFSQWRNFPLPGLMNSYSPTVIYSPWSGIGERLWSY